MEKLRITEIFYSLQGESTLSGIPTVFIRLTGCPLRCDYCDTPYAFTGGVKKNISEIINEVNRYGARHVTVTGGEPLAQSACLPLMTALLDLDYMVSLETSGAIDVSAVDPRVIKVMDLKTPSSGELNKNLYQNINYLSKIDQVKFVIGNHEDYEWSKQIVAKYSLATKCEVLFSPVQSTQNPTELADKILADRLPVRFQIQLHKYLWQDARGK